MNKTINLGPVSAYALAKKYGFVGTEAEWLKSLGACIGENGNWWVGNEDLGVLADPAELSKLTQQAQSAQTAAEGAAGAAAENAEAAQRFASNAGSAASAAADSASAAKTAQEAAAKSASAAADSAAAAQTSAEAASQSANEAAGSATAAQTAQNAAEAAQSAADADAEATAEARKIVESAAEAEAARVEAEKKRAAKDAERDGKISTIADGLSALRTRENVLTGSASGTVVSVEDAAAAPLCGLHIYGKSTQDGIPSPDSPVPIVSVGDSGTVAVRVTGKNLVQPFERNKQITNSGVTMDYDAATQVVHVHGTSSGRASMYDVSQRIPFAVKSVITISITKVSGDIPTGVTIQYSDFKTLGLTCTALKPYATGAFNRSDAPGFFRFALSVPAGLTVDFSLKVQLELGTTATAWQPYHEQLLTLSAPGGLPGIPVAAGGTYTDVDGQQWVCDEIDLVRGVYVQRVQPISISSIPNVEKVEISAGYRFESECLSYDNPIVGNKMELYDFATYKSRASVPEGSRDKWYAAAADHTLRFICPDSDSYDENSMREYLNSKCPLHGLAMLQNPIERPLTDDEITTYKALTTYAPNSVVQADGAHIALNYQRDMNIVIKNLEDAIASITTN